MHVLISLKHEAGLVNDYRWRISVIKMRQSNMINFGS